MKITVELSESECEALCAAYSRDTVEGAITHLAAETERGVRASKISREMMDEMRAKLEAAGLT